MKKTILILSAIALTSCYSRIGKLTIMSTRNFESNAQYVLIAKDVKGGAKTKKSDALEVAIDEAVRKYPNGEFMKNVSVEVKNNGKRLRVVGDVWGTQPAGQAK